MEGALDAVNLVATKAPKDVVIVEAMVEENNAAWKDVHQGLNNMDFAVDMEEPSFVLCKDANDTRVVLGCVLSMEEVVGVPWLVVFVQLAFRAGVLFTIKDLL